ncbi:MAG: hypothetical protein ACR2QU_02845, partial [Gammaproteobacteria bacterium]
MRKTLSLIVFILAPAVVLADSTEHGAWFDKTYAPLWESTPWENADAMAAAYSETLVSHSVDGAV